MRKILIGLLFVSLILSLGCGEQYPGKFSYSPEQPQIGDEVTVKFNPAGTELENAEEISLLAYQFFGAKMPTVMEVAMKKKGKGWIASFTPDDSSLLVFCNFAEGEVVDNNEQAGYNFLIYDSEGKTIPGGLAALAYAHYTGAYPVSIKRNRPLALETLEKEFEQYPDQKAEFNSMYWDLIMRVDKANGKQRVKIFLDEIAAKDEVTLKNKKTLASWYTRVGEKEKADKYYNEVIEAEPKGMEAQIADFRKFRAVTNIDKKVSFFKNFMSDYPGSRYAVYMTSVILRDYVKEKRYDEAEAFLSKYVQEPQANYYNSIAWPMAEEGVNFKTAADLAKKGIELARKDLDKPISEKPSYITEREWREQLKTPLSNLLDTYGYALSGLGLFEEAIPYLKEAVELSGKAGKDVNEHYVSALIEAGKNEEAFEITGEFLKEGNSTPKLEELFTKSYVAVKGSDEGAAEALAEMKEKGMTKLKEELKKEMLDKPAPDFSLQDIEGKTVSLADLKGKTLILDFWATWCGPCVRSFPAMQKAVDKFKEDENIQFLFINTWERGDNVLKNVTKFIEDKKYNFHVLMDLESKVVEAYGVEGIPTKFIVDKKGKIRFKSVGFGGNDEELVNELSLMIGMLK